MDRAVSVAEALGYESFSRFIVDLLEEAVAAYEASRRLGEKRYSAKRRVRDAVFALVFRRSRPA